MPRQRGRNVVERHFALIKLQGGDFFAIHKNPELFAVKIVAGLNMPDDFHCGFGCEPLGYKSLLNPQQAWS